MLRNCSLKISRFLLFICFLSLNSQLFAKEMKNCPEKFLPLGIKFTDLGKKQNKITITKSKFLKDALNNQSLAEHIALLKLDAVEEFQKINLFLKLLRVISLLLEELHCLFRYI